MTFTVHLAKKKQTKLCLRLRNDRLIFICLLVLSSVINILYIINIIGEIWFRIVFIIVMLCNILNMINAAWSRQNESNEPKVQNDKKFLLLFLICLLIAWCVTLFIAMLR